MAVEAIRGCGFRKVGGLYLVSEGLSEGCERFPIPLRSCGHCGQKVNQTRGFQWAEPDFLFANAVPCAPVADDGHLHSKCPVCVPGMLRYADPSDKIGLIWVGKKFYSPDGWLKEAMMQGASKRVPAIPKGLVIGKSRVMAAHPEGHSIQADLFEGAPEPGSEPADRKPGPAVISMFTVKRIELIVTETQMREKEEWLMDLFARGVTPVVVPDNDRDHAPAKAQKTKRAKARAKYERDPEPKKKDAEPPV